MKSLARIWLLFRLLWKSGAGSGLDMQGGLFNKRKKKRQSKLGKIGQTLLTAVLFVYLGGIMVYLSSQMSPLAIQMGQDRFLFEMFMALLAMMTLVFGLFSTFSSLAFSSDQDRLTVLPVKRGEVLIARLAVLAVYQVMLPLLLGLPFFATYGYYKGVSWTFYLRVLLAMVLQVLVPVSILVILCLLLIRLTPLAKNKDRFMLVSQLVMMVVILYLSMGPLNQRGGDMDMAQMQQLMAQPGLYKSLRLVIPNLDAWIDFMLQGGGASLWALVKALLIALVFLFIAYEAAHYLYRPEAGSQSKGKQLKRGQVAKLLRPRSRFKALLVRESKLVFRNPTLLLNNVLGSVLFIIIMPVSIYMGAKSSGDLPQISLDTVKTAIHTGFLDLPDFDNMIVIVLASLILSLVGAFMIGMSSLNASAVSRQGEEIYWSMTLPVSYRQQYAAKTLLAVLLSVTPYVLILGLTALLLEIPALLVIPPLAFFIWSATVSNLWPLLLDAKNPILDWENEITAIKNNKNILIAMILNWVQAGIYGFTIYLYLEKQLEPWLVLAGLAAFLLIQTLYLIWAIPRTVKRTMDRIENYL